MQGKVGEPANVDLHDAQAVLQSTRPCVVWSAWAAVHPEPSSVKPRLCCCITVYQWIRFMLQCPAVRKQLIEINPERRRARETLWIVLYPSLYRFPCPMSCAKHSTIVRETLLVSIACFRKRDKQQRGFLFFCFPFFFPFRKSHDMTLIPAHV